MILSLTSCNFQSVFLHLSVTFDISEMLIFRKKNRSHFIVVHRLDTLYAAQVSFIGIDQMLRGSGREPGDFGFDPLGFGNDPDKLKDLQMKDLAYVSANSKLERMFS